MKGPAIAFEEVSFSYPDSGVPALDRVTVAIPEGSFALVIGATGAGKSTFLRAVNGLVPHFTGGAFSGHVNVAGRDTLDGAPRDLADVVAFVPQDPGASFVVDRTEDEIAYGLENLGVAAPVMRRRVEETLDLLGLAELADRSVRTLSGGERQRVAIGAALAAGPRILVLDEPTSQLDPQGAEDVLAALQRLVHDLGITVVAAEHRLERVAGFADLVVTIEAGRASAGLPHPALGGYESPPPVTRVGRRLGWTPPPVTVREARRVAPSLAAPAPGITADPGPVRLEARALDAAYGRRRALSEVNIGFRSGEVTAVMGRNGSGKTTLLRCLAGLHAPEAGKVRFDGGPVRTGVDVALCPQVPEAALFRDSVSGEISATIGWSASVLRSESLLEQFGLTDLAARHPRDLSAGQRLLVAVAATVATGAPAILLDEPTRGLDLAAKERLAAYLRARAASGGVAVFATHDVEMVASAADRVVILGRGEVIADGEPRTVMGDSAVFAPQMTRVFGPGWLTPDQVLGHLEAAGFR